MVQSGEQGEVGSAGARPWKPAAVADVDDKIPAEGAFPSRFRLLGDGGEHGGASWRLGTARGRPEQRQTASTAAGTGARVWFPAAEKR